MSRFKALFGNKARSCSWGGKGGPQGAAETERDNRLAEVGRKNPYSAIEISFSSPLAKELGEG
jgi:hypothetical protein